jgi:glutamate formiminotransferase
VAVGARLPLLAYNVNLRTRDLTVAKRIARKIRASSGGFPKVKALGFALEERGLTQVSMNLTDYRVTGIWKVFTTIAALAREQGVEVDGSEIVGTLPLEAAAQLVRDAVEASAFTAEQILEKKVWQPH